MSKGVHISHGAIALGAKESFQPSASEKAVFVNLEDLKSDSVKSYANPCELYQTILDGAADAVPSDMEGLGYWSEQTTGEDYLFKNPIILELNADEYFSSIGITFIFDTLNDIHPNRISVDWYRDDTLLSSAEYQPNSAMFFCKNSVELYNRVLLTVYGLNMPYNRLKITGIQYGTTLEIDAEHTRSVSVSQSIEPLSSQLPISTASYTFEAESGADLIFQENQPIRILFDDKLVSKCYLKSARRKSKTLWSVEAEESIGVLQRSNFMGGIYSNKIAAVLFSEILVSAGLEYEIAEVYSNMTLSGYLPISDCRMALQQVAFAVGAVVETAGIEKVKISPLSSELTQTIPLDRIMQGQYISSSPLTTAVEVTAHRYEPKDEEITAFDANVAGEGIFVRFNEPLHSLRIEGGEILSFGANYAVVNSNQGCKLYGKRYEHTQTIFKRKNPFLTSANEANIVTVEKATLVTAENVDSVLERCYNEYAKNKNINLRIVERPSTNNYAKYGQALYGTALYGTPNGDSGDMSTKVGDLISCETEYSGEFVGRIIRQSFELSGRVKVKDSVVRGELNA